MARPVQRAERMGNMTLAELTVVAARGTMRLVERLPRDLAFYRIAGQLFDCGTSQAANYRAARRARSTRDLIGKLKIVEEESDEASFWIDRLFDAKLPEALHADARLLQDQMDHITAMTVESIKTSRRRLNASTRNA